jgi:hypothetical protein
LNSIVQLPSNKLHLIFFTRIWSLKTNRKTPCRSEFKSCIYLIKESSIWVSSFGQDAMQLASCRQHWLWGSSSWGGDVRLLGYLSALTWTVINTPQNGACGKDCTRWILILLNWLKLRAKFIHAENITQLDHYHGILNAEKTFKCKFISCI